MRQSPPVVENEPAASPPPARPRRTPDERRAHWDWTVVGVMTPVLIVTLLGATFALGQIFYPDPSPPTLVFPTPRPLQRAAPPPTPVVATEPIDTARVNSGVVDRPLPF